MKSVAIALHGHITDIPPQPLEMRRRSVPPLTAGDGDPLLIVEGRDIDIVADVDIVEQRHVEIVGTHVLVADVAEKDILQRGRESAPSVKLFSPIPDQDGRSCGRSSRRDG